MLLLADPKDLTGDAAANYQIIEKAGLPIEVFSAPLDVAQFDAELSRGRLVRRCNFRHRRTGEPKSPLAEAIDG